MDDPMSDSNLAAPDGMVEFPCDAERLENGNTLITDAGDEAGQGSEVVEVDPAGNIVWRYAEGLRFAHSAKRLNNGNTLITDTTNDRVIEVTPAGEVVLDSDRWADGTGRLGDGSRLHYPNDAHQLPDGRLIITDRNNDRFVICDRDGGAAMASSVDIRHPHNADMLPNGNVVVADSDGDRVLEIGSDGKILWSCDGAAAGGLKWPRDCDRLANGNSLVGDSKNSRVLELTPDGKVAWQFAFDHFANVYDVDRLANGNTLITDQQHHEVVEVNPLGEVVWRFNNYRRIRPVYDELINPAFTELERDVSPTGWLVATRLSEGGGELAWTQADGQRCAGLAFDREGALCLQQTVKVTPGVQYTLKGMIRSEDAEGVAFMQLAWLDAAGGFTGDVITCPKGRMLKGTTDWQRDRVDGVAPANAVACDVRLFIGGAGKVFWRDLKFYW